MVYQREIPWYIKKCSKWEKLYHGISEGEKVILLIYILYCLQSSNTYIRNNYLERQNGGNFDFYDDITFEFEGTE